MASWNYRAETLLRDTSASIKVDYEVRFVAASRSGILVVDGDAGVRQSLELLLAAAGYKASCAHNGFEVLEKLKRELPTLLLCDLGMPGMSGFELLTIVRRRFPEVAVVAMSGAFAGDVVPEGVVADAFYGKGQTTPPDLFRILAKAVQKAALRSRCPRAAPVIWAPRIGAGECSVLVTCTDCLRSFVVVVPPESGTAVRQACCRFCKSELQYIAELSLASVDGTGLFLVHGAETITPKRRALPCNRFPDWQI